MQEGDIVTVYENAITQEKPEGRAELIKCVNPTVGLWDGENVSLWLVHFLGDYIGEYFTRKIWEGGQPVDSEV